MTDREGPEAPRQGLERFENLTAEEIIAVILPRGHAINGFSSADNERVIKILGSKEECAGDRAPMLGYGVDGDAEMALGRALATYIQRERDGLPSMHAGQYPELIEGSFKIDGHRSKFDNIVWGSDVTIFQEGDEIVITSTYGGGWGLQPLEVRASTVIGAITLLTQRYKFMSSLPSIIKELNMLPSVAWTPKGAQVQTPREIEVY